MRMLARLIDFVLNRCPSCGLAAQTICQRCWRDLNDDGAEDRSNVGASPLRGMYVIETTPFVQRALYLWDDRQIRSSSILREVILASKEHPSSQMMQLWAEEFHRRALMSGTLNGKRNWILIPPPGRSGQGEDDHAGALAKAIGACCGSEIAVELGMLERVGESRRSKSRSQKTKSRLERGAIEFRISPLMQTRVAGAEGFLFIDDVIATGATAKAAWIALGRPRAFECWAIAYKVHENLEAAE